MLTSFLKWYDIIYIISIQIIKKNPTADITRYYGEICEIEFYDFDWYVTEEINMDVCDISGVGVRMGL